MKTLLVPLFIFCLTPTLKAADITATEMAIRDLNSGKSLGGGLAMSGMSTSAAGSACLVRDSMDQLGAFDSEGALTTNQDLAAPLTKANGAE